MKSHNLSTSGGNAKSMTVKKNWLIVSLITMVMTILWVGSSVYFALKKTNIPAPQKQRTASFSTELNENVFDLLSARQQISARDLNEDDRVKVKPPAAQPPTIETSSTVSEAPPEESEE